MQVIKFFIAALVAAIALQAGAQVQQARGQATVNYKDAVGRFDRQEVPSSAKQKARRRPL